MLGTWKDDQLLLEEPSCNQVLWTRTTDCSHENVRYHLLRRKHSHLQLASSPMHPSNLLSRPVPQKLADSILDSHNLNNLQSGEGDMH